MKQDLVALLGICSSLYPLTVTAADVQKKQPNILIIIGDDCTYSDLPVYGGTNLRTPNIDNLASKGIVFNKAYLSMSMSVPCRAELYSGLYPMSNGVCWNHSAARPEIKGIGHYMGELGYRVGLAGKTHINPPSVYRFEMVDGIERDCVSLTAEFDPAGVRDFINRDNSPFCLVAAFTMPHCPWTVGDTAHFNADEIKLPAYIADTKESRSDFRKYLAEIEELDYQIGKLLNILENSGKADNTVVIFTSEQGAQWPGCKWTNWNDGVHTAFIVRWPGVINSGTRTDALIQYCDVLPTLIEIAGGKILKDQFDGSSFLPVLVNKTGKHREFAYFMHNNIPEGPAYPIRAVTNGTYNYIRNLTPENIYIEKHVMGEMMWHEYWPSWVFTAIDNDHTNYLVNRYMVRPAEELYNSEEDPDNMKTLINDKKYSAVKQKLSNALDAWMKEEKDPGKSLDSREFQRASRNGKPLH
jgi:N-sulfoglucosamine sulfohydrolase